MTKTNSYINKLLKITLIGCLAIIAIAIQSCTSKQRNEGTAYDDSMRWLDDSIAALAPSAPQAIEHVCARLTTALLIMNINCEWLCTTV